MIIRTVAFAAIAALLNVPVFADGGPVPESDPEPAPTPPEPAPVYEPAPDSAATGGLYASLAGGAVWLSDMEFDIEVPSITPGAVVDSDTGWAVVGAFGYDFGNGPRAELEVGYRANDGLLNDNFGGGMQLADSNVSALDVMANVLYGFGSVGFLQPYLGAGIGAAQVDIEFEFGELLREADAWAFAYQFIGGVDFPLANTGAVLFVDYRYLGTAGLETSPEHGFEGLDEYRTHNLLGGFRVNF